MLNEFCHNKSFPTIIFKGDFDKNTMVVYLDDNHVHIGNMIDGTFDELIDDLYDTLIQFGNQDTGAQKYER